MIPASWRRARWLRVVAGGVRRRWRLLRVTGALLAALGLLSVAVIGGEEPVWAQEAESDGVGIAFNDLSNYPTHLTVDGFMVELTNLTATEEYQVSVSSDSAGLGIGGCGTSSQKATVTGVAERVLSFAVYACAVGEATVTAEVRLAGASESEASISRLLTVEELPDVLIQADGTRVRAPPPGTVAKAGTPGIVPSIEFFDKTATSVSVRWGQPSDGGIPGMPLTGFGLKFWKEGIQEPGWGPDDVQLVGPPPTPSEYTKTGMERGARYNFRIHACNGVDSCGYWTNPPKIVGVPKKPHTISVVDRTSTSARVKWSPEADTGGVDLTGFGILWRVKDTPWRYDQAEDVDDDARAYTMSPLTANTTYQVSLQSCNARDSCSAWTVPDSRSEFTTQGPEQIVDSPPGPVRDLQITGVEDGTLKVDWEAPSSPNNTVTGYKLQRKLHANSLWPSTVTPVTASKLDISRLTNGTKYDVRVQACNDNTDDPCGDWVSPVCGVPGTTTLPGQVGIPSLTSSHETLTVSWDVPACVSAITHYEVQATTAPSDETVDPTWPSAGEDVSGATETDLDGLVNGTSYLVRVRACNSAIPTSIPIPNNAQCGTWSEAKPGTPSSVRLGTPSGLDIEPLPQRRARLTWDAVTTPDAEEYDVEVQVFGETVWLDADCVVITPGIGGRPPTTSLESTVEQPACEFNLDAITTDGGTKGLADNPAYRFQVKATASGFSQSHYSEIVIIIDTPITVSNGHSPPPNRTRDNGEAELTWNPIGKILAPTFTGGTYSFRYRRADGDHTSVGWQPGAYVTDHTEDTSRLRGGDTITGLTHQAIYAIQLQYDQTGKPKVFAARDAYVWPSNMPADDENTVVDAATGARVDVHARVAGFPLDYRLLETTAAGHPKFEYRICGETFTDEGRQGDWERLIKNAFDRWQAALPTDLVTIVYSSEDCTDFTPLTTKIVKSLDTYITDQSLIDGIPPSDDDKSAHVDGLLAMIRATGMIEGVPYDIDQTIRDDRSLNEVIMYNDSRGDLPFLSTHGIFTEISTVVMAGSSGRPFSQIIGQDHACWSGGNELMCTRTDKTYDTAATRLTKATSDIFSRRSKFEVGVVTNVTTLDVPAADARANWCNNDSDMANSAYRSVLHEIGHVLGIGRGEINDTSAGWVEGAHPLIHDAVMNYEFDEPDCAPYPFDLMAIYALYQSR